MTARRPLRTLTLAALAAAGCGRDAAPPPPRLVLVYATCSVNKGFLSPYDPAVATTPHLDRFAREAVVFRRHQTESGQSGTAFASIFTGSQADRHGVFRHPTPLPEEVATIGEAFRDGGYDVLAWLDHDMASGELGYGQGAAAGDVFARRPLPDDRAWDEVLDALRRDPGKKTFVLTSFTVTHGPYQTAALDAFCGRYPGECRPRDELEGFERYADFYRDAHAFLSYDFPATRERTAMDDGHLENLVATVELLYRANVAYLDHIFGELVAKIRAAGLWDETAIAFTADHGETLFREGTYFKWTHGHQLAPEVLGVPFLLRSPGLAPGDYDGVTRSIDVMPTLLGLAGLEGPAPDGVDLSAALLGRAPPPELVAYSHTSLISEPVLEASRRWGLFHRLIPRVDPELMWVQRRDGDRVVQLRRNLAGELVPAVFDLASDPGTLANLFDPGDAVHRQALADLRRYRERLILAYPEHAARGETVDPERAKELLRGLGYIDD